jgi:predicted AAA+ superfamily ATPase
MTPMIPRPRHVERIRDLFQVCPVVAILGARQVGKTTLAREFARLQGGPVAHLDLEDPDVVARLAEPRLALGHLEGLVVIDEVQRRPDLFPILRVLVDREGNSARFLLLGSASPDLLRQTSESLAGRIAYHHLDGFALDEVGIGAADTLWWRGGFPRSFLATSDPASVAWRRSFVRTFLERDLPQLGSQVPPASLHRFWRMIAHYHGQTWNGAELARAFGVAATTVRRYLDVFTGALVLRQLPPWHENLTKRQVRSPKVYVADSGLLHSLLGVDSQADLHAHPKVGASWEGLVLQEMVAALGAHSEECYFWATHAGAELDLFVARGAHRIGVEVKRTTSPGLTKSMHTAIASLRLDRLYLVHAGEHSFPLSDTAEAVAFADLRTRLRPL